jgi:hypothetical protein
LRRGARWRSASDPDLPPIVARRSAVS